MRQLLMRKFHTKKDKIVKGEMTAFLHILNPQPPEGYGMIGWFNGRLMFKDDGNAYFFGKAIYYPEETIYIREDWTVATDEEGKPYYVYKADDPDSMLHHWKPASYMPIEAARIFLTVTHTDALRAGDITKDQAKAMGITGRDWRKQIDEIAGEETWVQIVHFRQTARPAELPTGINEKIIKHGTSFNVYTIRLAETGEILAHGTARECAKAMGYDNLRRIYILIGNVKAGRNAKYTVEVKDAFDAEKTEEQKKNGWLRD